MAEDLKLNVFISWSGPRASAVAKELKNWLKVAFQFTEPFLSQEIDAGKKWGKSVADALARSNFGILVLTPENMSSEWMLFEAGALAKHLDEARVVPLLVDLSPSQLRQPLSDFQAVRMPDQLFNLARSLNDAQPDPWDGQALQNAYKWTHEKFLRGVEQTLKKASETSRAEKPDRPIRDVLDELLQAVKGLRPVEPSDEYVTEGNDQYYPVNDRILLYKFLKDRVQLPLYKKASMPALFDAAARFVQLLKPMMDGEEALVVVAKYLVSERPLQDLLEGLKQQEKADAEGK